MSVELGFDADRGRNQECTSKRYLKEQPCGGIADYLLFGSGPDEDNRSYEERLEETVS